MADDEAQGKRILIVDDDPDFLGQLESKLYFAGYKVIKAENGQKAIELAKQESPDLIILDVQMPVMDGMATAVALKKGSSTKDIPLIYLSALQSKEDEQNALKERGSAQPNMVFAKDQFESTEFLNGLKDILAD